MSPTFLFISLVNVLALIALIGALGVFKRHSPRMKIGEAVKHAFFWMAISLLFSIGILIFAGAEKWLRFLTDYIFDFFP